MAANQLWYPDTSLSKASVGENVSDYAVFNKPEKDLKWTQGYQTSGKHTFKDSETGVEFEYKSTVDAGDRFQSGTEDIWYDDPSGAYCRIGADVKKEHQWFWGWGVHNVAQDKFDSYELMRIPDVVGWDFQYRWSSGGNYLSYAPVWLNQCHFHYFNEDRSKKYYYKANIIKASPEGTQWPHYNRPEDDKKRTSDRWKAARYKIGSGAIKQVHEKGLNFAGIYVSFKHKKTASVSYKMSMDFRWAQLLFEPFGGIKPLFCHPRTNLLAGGPFRLYTI